MQKNSICHSIREAILRGDLKPGQPITEERLSQALKVSRTPIREALIRLESEGLVRILKNKGAFVREITSVDIAEIFQLRILLESHAARTCISFISMDDVRGALEGLRGLEGQDGRHQDKVALGARVHELVVASTGNGRLQRLVDVLKTQIAWVQSYAALLPGRSDKAFYEHIEILEAIRERDGDRAEAAMKLHLENTRRELLDVANLPRLSVAMR